MKHKFVLPALLMVCALLAACGGATEKSVTIDVEAACAALKVSEIDGEKYFSEFKTPADDFLTDSLGIDIEQLENRAALVSPNDMSPCMVLLLVPKQEARDEVKSELAAGLEDYQKRWDNYLPEQAALVHERMETEIGDCLITIISPDNDTALDAVRSAENR
ncbi:MAG: DUF4358 domain-containing protein [Oscillospiraceae bacterium]